MHQFETRLADVSPVELGRFVGHYRGEGRPLPTAGRFLKLTLPNGLRFLLAPLAADSFRVIGVPGAYVAFGTVGGRVRHIRLSREHGESITLVPR